MLSDECFPRILVLKVPFQEKGVYQGFQEMAGGRRLETDREGLRQDQEVLQDRPCHLPHPGDFHQPNLVKGVMASVHVVFAVELVSLIDALIPDKTAEKTPEESALDGDSAEWRQHGPESALGSLPLRENHPSQTSVFPGRDD